jgi:hypothetical protein
MERLRVLNWHTGTAFNACTLSVDAEQCLAVQVISLKKHEFWVRLLSNRQFSKRQVATTAPRNDLAPCRFEILVVSRALLIPLMSLLNSGTFPVHQFRTTSGRIRTFWSVISNFTHSPFLCCQDLSILLISLVPYYAFLILLSQSERRTYSAIMAVVSTGPGKQVSGTWLFQTCKDILPAFVARYLADWLATTIFDAACLELVFATGRMW